MTKRQVKALPKEVRLAAFERVRALNPVAPFDATKPPIKRTEGGDGARKSGGVSLSALRKGTENVQQSASPQATRNGSSMSPPSRQTSVDAWSVFSPTPTPPVHANITRDGTNPGERRPKHKQTSTALPSPPRILTTTNTSAPAPAPAPNSQEGANPGRRKAKHKQTLKTSLNPRGLTSSTLRSTNRQKLPKKPASTYGARKRKGSEE